MSLLSPSLIAFLAVVRKSTVLDAAKDLNLTQTAVTQRIKILENNLGVTLFLRSRRGMLLTEDGKALLQFCNASKELEGIVLSRLNRLGNKTTTTLRVAARSSIIQSRVLPKLSQLSQQFPNLRFNLINSDNLNPIEHLKSAEADLVFAHPKSIGKELDSAPVAAEETILVASQSFKRMKTEHLLRDLPLIALDQVDSLGMDFLTKHKLSKFAHADRHFSNGVGNSLEMLKSGLGYAALPESIVHNYLKTKILFDICPGKSLSLPLAAAWYPRPVMPEYFQKILKVLK